MSTRDIVIKPYSPAYLQDIVQICYHTGFYGEDLADKNLFSDPLLFAMRFALHYLNFEPELNYVAVINDRAVGYIIGTSDTIAQKQDFSRTMYYRILARMYGYSLWKNRQDVIWMNRFIRHARRPHLDLRFLIQYPAHLHINILPLYQSQGLGQRLLDRFISTLHKKGVPGLHLGTSTANLKANPFYLKNQFQLLQTQNEDMWNTGENHQALLYGKYLL